MKTNLDTTVPQLQLALEGSPYSISPTGPVVLLARDSAGDLVEASAEQVVEAASFVLDTQLKAKKIDLKQPSTVKTYVRTKLFGLEHEVIIGLFIDSQFRLIECVQLARGTLSQASCYPREVAKESLRLNAAAVILAHNHPSGIAEPSSADIRLTLELKKALALVDVRLLDHLVVGAEEAISLAELGHV